MSRQRVDTVLLSALLVAAAVVAALLVNLLLDRASAQNDPVGKLRPSASFPAAPRSVVRPQTGPTRGEHYDD